MASNATSFPLALHSVADTISKECHLSVPLTCTAFIDKTGTHGYPQNAFLITTADKDVGEEAKSCSALFSNHLWKVVGSLWKQLPALFRLCDYDHIFILFNEMCLVQRSVAEPRSDQPHTLFLQLEYQSESSYSSSTFSPLSSYMTVKDLSLVLWGAVFGIVLYRTVKSE